jgi:phosphohistidine phosphatase
MKRLHLLRHAKSSWDEAELPDIDRPLAPRGEKAAKAIAKHLDKQGIAPELILCSPSVRTRETLDRLGLEESETRFENAIYEATAGELLEVVHVVRPGLESVMLIGHNPGMERLAMTLARGGDGDALDRMRRKYPTAALATLTFYGSWAELGPDDAELAAFVTPKQLRE